MKKLLLVVLFVTGSCTTVPSLGPHPNFYLRVSGKVVHIDREIIGSFSTDAERFVLEHSVVLYFVKENSSESSAEYIGEKNGDLVSFLFTSVTEIGGVIEQFVNGKSVDKHSFTFLIN